LTKKKTLFFSGRTRHDPTHAILFVAIREGEYQALGRGNGLMAWLRRNELFAHEWHKVVGGNPKGYRRRGPRYQRGEGGGRPGPNGLQAEAGSRNARGPLDLASCRRFGAHLFYSRKLSNAGHVAKTALRTGTRLEMYGKGRLRRASQPDHRRKTVGARSRRAMSAVGRGLAPCSMRVAKVRNRPAGLR